MARREREGREGGRRGGMAGSGPRNYHELGKLGGEARKRQLMGGRED